MFLVTPQPAVATPSNRTRTRLGSPPRWSTYLRLTRLALQRRLCRIVVDGESMLPGLRSGQIVWCEARPANSELRIGDIVVFSAAASQGDPSGELGIKRIIALGTVIDGRSGLEEPSCEVRGDNSSHSADSRHFGPVPLRNVVGRVILTGIEAPSTQSDRQARR